MKSFDGWQRMLAFCILLVYGTMLLPAQEIYLSRQLGGMYLEQYLDRADLERSQQRWQQLADQGVLVALSAWESAHLYLLEQDPTAWEKQRLEAQMLLEQETQLRLAQWLLQSYMSQQGKPFFQTLSTRLQEKASLWQYQSAQGDSAPTRQVDGTQAAQAQSQWIASNQDLIHQLLEEAALADSELEEQLADLELADSLRQELVREAAVDYRNYLAAEYDLILRSETSQLMGDLLYDRESLRAVSGQQSAEVLAQELIQEAKHNTDIAVGELFASFQQEIHEDQRNQIQLQPQNEEWVQDFQRQLEEGLEIWNRTEEEFLRRRSQWEQEAVSTYEESQEAWLSAFQKIRAARQEWETEILEEFKTGMDDWSKSQQQQELEIQVAQQELALSMEEEVMRKSQLAAVSVQVYNQVRSLLASCHQGIESWYGRWAEKYHKVYSYWKTEDAERYNQLFGEGQLLGLDEALEASEQNKLRMDMSLQELSSHESRTKIEMQVDQWKAGYLEYFREELRDAQATITNKIEEYQQELSKPSQFKEKEIRKQMDECTANRRLLQVVLADLVKVDSSTTASEIASLLNTQFVLNHTGLSFDSSLWESSEILLNQDTGWLVLSDAGLKSLEETTKSLLEAFDPNSLDGSSSELDAELQRLETLLSYWQDELAVAEALRDYATTTTSSAETAAETQQEMEQADQRYQQALEDYQLQQETVDTAMDSIEEAMKELEGKQLELDEVEVRVEEIKNQLAAVQETDRQLDKEVVEGQIVKVLDTLAKSFSQEQEDKLHSLVKSYFQKEFEIGNESFNSTMEKLLENIPTRFRDRDNEYLSKMISSFEEPLDSLKASKLPEPPASSESPSPGQEPVIKAVDFTPLRNLSTSISQDMDTTQLDSLLDSIEVILASDPSTLTPDQLTQLEKDLAAATLLLVSFRDQYQDELDYRNEAKVYLLEQEPDSWKQFSDTAVPEESHQRIQERKDKIVATYENLTVNKLNEAHSQGVQKLQEIVDGGLWQCSTWDEVVALTLKIRHASTNLHASGKRSVEQLIGLIVQHWAMGNPQSARTGETNPSSQSTGNVAITSREVQLHLDKLYLVETDISNVEIVLSVLEDDIPTNHPDRTKFMDYAATLIFQDIGSQNLGPVTDESDFLSLLRTEFFSWNKEFQSLTQETQQSIARQVLQLKADAELQTTDSPESGSYDDSFRPVLEGLISEMEEKQFLLELEEMCAYHLKTDDSSRLAEMVGLAQAIQGSSFLVMDRWQAVQTMTQKDGFMNMELGRIEMLGQSWFQSILDCGDQPYQYVDPAQQVVLEGGEADNSKEENSTHELDGIIVLLDTSWYEESLSPLMNLYQIIDSSKTELEDKKLVLEEELHQAEGERNEIVASFHQQNRELEKRLESYNLEVQSENFLHQNLLDARLRQRIAQEKYQWASRIYLDSLGSSESSTPNAYKSPLSRYNDTLLAVNRHQQALDILRQIKGKNGSLGDKEYERQLLDYQQALGDSYVMQVVLSQSLTAVVKQEQATQEAELKDQINVSKLLFSHNQLAEVSGTEKAVPLLSESPALELVRITRDDAGNYILSLGHSTDYVKTGTMSSIDSDGNSSEIDIYGYVTSLRPAAGTLDEALLEEYLTAKSETVTQVKETLKLTRAEVEARQWLKDMYSKGDDYLNRLLLASLHLKTYSDRSKEFLGGQVDLREEGQFQADQLPNVGKFHSVDVSSLYTQERVSAAASAYSSIMSQEGGEGDLARYILYRETSLLDKQEWMKREKALVEWLALEEVREELADKQNAKTVEAAVSFALAASLSIAAIFCKPLWAAVYAATCIAITATDAAISLKEAKNSVGDLENGKQSIVSAETRRLGGLMDCLLAGEADLAEQWELLNVFYYGGQAAEEGGSLSHEKVTAALDKMLAGSPLVSGKEYGELVSRERVDAMLSGDGQKVTDILKLVAGELAGGLSLAELSLGQEAARLREQSQAAMAEFYRTLGQSVTIAEEDLQRLAELEAQATDESLATAQRQAALIEYNALYQSLHTMDGSSQAQLVSFATRAFGNQGWDSLAHKKNVYNSGKSLYNTRVDLSTETELYTVWLQDLLAQQAAAGWKEGASQVMEQAQLKWDLERDLLAHRRQLWEGEVAETLAAGRSSWQRMEEKLNKEYTLWRRRFQKELEERQEEWESSYLEYLQEKEAWVQESHRQALTQGVVANAELPPSVSTKALEERAARLSRSMESGASHQMAAATVEAILGEADLRRLIERSATMASLGRSAAMGIKRVHRGASSLENHLVVREQVSSNSQLMKRLAGRQAADYGQELLEQILEGYMEGIDRQNQAMVEWQERLAWNAGYSVDGDIRRTVVVDATLMNPIRETQHLPVYQHFRTTAPRLRSLDAGSEKNAMTQLGLAQQELELWGRSILGDKGLFAEHRGAAPELAGTPDPSGSKRAAFRDLGSGQMGAILVEYYWNSIQARKGMAELSKPGHDKRLFDDRGLPFTAPTLREVSEVAMNIIGSATGQAWWFSYIDDAIFAGIDLGGGYKTAGEIGREVAVKAAGVAIGAGTNWAGDIAGTALAESGKAVNFLVQGSISGGGAYLGSVATNYIAGGDGGWADAGNLAGFAGGFVSGGLGGVNLRDGDGIMLSDKVFDVEGISAMNGLAGGLASTAVSFGMTGNATFNLASIKGVGLLEVTLGRDGISSRLGSGGMSLSAEPLTAVSRGRQETEKVLDWKYGGEESRSTLNGVNELGHTEKEHAIALSKEIWEGKRNVEYEMGADGVLGRTDGNTIYINDKLLNRGLEGSVQIASLLDHEYTHILGGDEFIARLSGYDTYNILSDKFSLASSELDDVTDISYFSNVLKNEGENGLFSELFFMDAFSDINDGNEYYFGIVNDPLWRQNDGKVDGTLLGGNFPQEVADEYNANLKEKMLRELQEREYEEYHNSLEDKDSAIPKDKYKDYSYTNAEMYFASEDSDDEYIKKNWENLYATVDTLSAAGCTAATAAYIAYSISGRLMSFSEANKLLVENDVYIVQWFQDSTGKWREADAGQKKYLAYGDNYAKAVNTLAGGDVLAYMYSKTDNLKELLFQAETDLDVEYFVHMRTNTENRKKNYNYHSVLFSGLNLDESKEYGSKPDGEPYSWYYSDTIDILDPWAGSSGKRKLSDIGRADFYFLTQEGQRMKHDDSYLWRNGYKYAKQADTRSIVF